MRKLLNDPDRFFLDLFLKRTSTPMPTLTSSSGAQVVVVAAEDFDVIKDMVVIANPRLTQILQRLKQDSSSRGLEIRIR